MNVDTRYAAYLRWWLYFVPRLVFMIGVLVFVVFTLIRARATYDIERRANALQHQVDLLEATMNAVERDSSARLDTLEQTLFVDVKPKVDQHDKIPKNTVELWQANRDRELRENIRQLQSRIWELEHPRDKP